MTDSRQKGKRGELDVVHEFRDNGIRAERTAQRSGQTGVADVNLLDYPQIHVEVKRHKEFWGRKPKDAMNQAINDSRENTIPIVVGRGDKENWNVLISLGNFISLIKKNKDINGEG